MVEEGTNTTTAAPAAAVVVVNYTSRSAVLDYQACPRLRLLGWELYKGKGFVECEGCGNAYALDGEFAAEFGMVSECAFCGSPMRVLTAHVGGLAPKRKSIYLVVGEAVHVGLEHMLRRACAPDGYIQETQTTVRISPQVLDDSAAAALQCVDGYGPQGVNLHGCPPEWQDWKFQEQRAMVEGLVRAFGLAVLPTLLERYRVLEVEQECQMPLDGGGGSGEGGGEVAGGLVFQARIDALLEERDTGDLHILSFKTAKEWSKQSAMQFRRDMQGLTEAMTWEAQHGQPSAEHPGGRRIEMTQMLILLKGKEYEDKWAGAPGKWVHYSPLTRAYRLAIPGIVPEFDSSKWAWSYDVPKTYVRGDRKGETYMGTLEKDWKPTSTWDNYPGGMKAWVEDLYRGKWQPEMGDPFAKSFVMPEPWSRAQQEMEDMREQLVAQELEVVEDVRYYQDLILWGVDDPDPVRSFLNRKFRQHRASCSRYGGMCWAEGICFGGSGGGGDAGAPFFPVEELLAPGGGRRLRSPHHQVVEVGAS